MTNSEAGMIVMTLRANYPNSYQKLGEREIAILTRTWSESFADLPAETVWKGLRTYMDNDESGFPPTTGQVKARIRNTMSSSGEILGAEDCWNKIRKAAGNSTYHAKEEFANLPEPAKRFLGDANELKRLGGMEMDLLNSKIRKNFLEFFKSSVESVPIPEQIMLGSQTEQLLHD